jgi:AcrR family transcriptional regulator
MTRLAPPSPRDRILQAALTLLETGGIDAVSTRSVSAAADVQPPTIYRQFGDMDGLLDAVMKAGFAAYIREIEAQEPTSGDAVGNLRRGWTLHREFGLAHPHLYTLMYGTPRPGSETPAALEASIHLHALLQRVAEAGRLAVSLEQAAAMMRAGGEGATLRLISTQTRDRALSDLMCEVVLSAILTPEGAAVGGTVKQRAAAHAVSLIALMPEVQAPFSQAEETLLVEWLRRLL